MSILAIIIATFTSIHVSASPIAMDLQSLKEGVLQRGSDMPIIPLIPAPDPNSNGGWWQCYNGNPGPASGIQPGIDWVNTNYAKEDNIGPDIELVVSQLGNCTVYNTDAATQTRISLCATQGMSLTQLDPPTVTKLAKDLLDNCNLIAGLVGGAARSRMDLPWVAIDKGPTAPIYADNCNGPCGPGKMW